MCCLSFDKHIQKSLPDMAKVDNEPDYDSDINSVRFIIFMFAFIFLNTCELR